MNVLPIGKNIFKRLNPRLRGSGVFFGGNSDFGAELHADIVIAGKLAAATETFFKKFRLFILLSLAR